MMTIPRVAFLFTIVLLLTTSCRPIHNLAEKFKSPILLSGYCEHTMTSVVLELRQDKSFCYHPGSFLKSDVAHGCYRLSADTVILQFRDSTKYRLSHRLLFRDTTLVEIGDSLAHRHRFTITVNKLNRHN